MTTFKKVIFGSAGTGKTYRLMQTLDELFKNNYSPEQICFCTFTKSASEEVKRRCTSHFKFDKQQMVYFGTIHSLCFRRFCFGKDVVGTKELSQFFKKKMVDYEETGFDEDIITENYRDEVGNILIQFYDHLRTIKCLTIYDVENEDELKNLFHEIGKQEENFSKIFSNSISPFQLLHDYEEFKKENNLVDFSDMLLGVLKEKWIVPTKVLIVDEVQDLSPIQWAIYRLWCEGKDKVIIAGDDDQTIYGFNGAEAKTLLKEKESADEVEILDKTFRICEKIHVYCRKWIEENIDSNNRVFKDVKSVKEGGIIEENYIDGNLEKVIDFLRNNKKTFILFRTNSFKKQFVNEVLVPNGILYGEIRGTSLWNERTINLFNAVIKLNKKEVLSPEEVKYLINNIPARIKLFRRGLKSKFDGMQKKSEYTVTDLLSLGFEMSLFDYLQEFRIFDILNLKDNIRDAFKAHEKKVITFPLNVIIGTIHSSKGREADDVILFKDVSKKIAREIVKDKESWENEMRVFHTGQTRVKERLIILRGGFNFAESDLIP